MSTEWAQYLAKGVWRNDPTTLYHMSEVGRYEGAMENRDAFYFPPTYEQDGFIHATAIPSLLIEVANHFYQDSKDEWICMEINPKYLNCRVIYEAPAPVGNKASKFADNDSAAAENDTPKTLFPHIYGGISKMSITKIYKIVRDTDGKFISIDGL